MIKSEAQPRAELIDKQLERAGWSVKDPTQVVEEYDILTALPEGVTEPHTPYEGHQFSDYVLLGKDAKPLAVVEAKKSSKDATLGREQAKQYCFNSQKQTGGELPFCFYTNGLETHFWDLDNIIRDESQLLSPHFFDFIVIDESHRSIYNTYGEIIDHFKTITLGLTATPTELRHPPIDLQNQFAVIHEKVDCIKSRYQQNLTDLENLYDALSQQAFRDANWICHKFL